MIGSFRFCKFVSLLTRFCDHRISAVQILDMSRNEAILQSDGNESHHKSKPRGHHHIHNREWTFLQTDRRCSQGAKGSLQSSDIAKKLLRPRLQKLFRTRHKLHLFPKFENIFDLFQEMKLNIELALRDSLRHPNHPSRTNLRFPSQFQFRIRIRIH